MCAKGENSFAAPYILSPSVSSMRARAFVRILDLGLFIAIIYLSSFYIYYPRETLLAGASTT